MLEEKFVEFGDVRFAYYEAGPVDGTLVITLHGGRGFGSKSSDFSVYSKLADYGYHVISYDFRGHGNSSFQRPFTFAQIVKDTDDIRKHFVQNAKCIIIGGSFGGFLAQQYAITYPENTLLLILRGTAPSHHHESQAVEVLKSRLHKAPNASVDMLLKVFSSFESDEEMRLVMFALAPLYSETYNANAGLKSVLSTKYSSVSHNDLYSEEEKYFDYTSKLPQIKSPTLILVGSEDWICPKPQSELMHELIPNSELVVIENANHSVHVEKPKEVIDLILNFARKSI